MRRRALNHARRLASCAACTLSQSEFQSARGLARAWNGRTLPSDERGVGEHEQRASEECFARVRHRCATALMLLSVSHPACDLRAR